jgi:FtsZ-binding cell division protein ZapB
MKLGIDTVTELQLRVWELERENAELSKELAELRRDKIRKHRLSAETIDLICNTKEDNQ